MGQAYKCELTGALKEGAGVMVIEVPLSETMKAEVRIFKLVNKETFTQQAVSDEGAAMVANALGAIGAKLPVEKKAEEKKK